jgi:hypothetical protein
LTAEQYQAGPVNYFAQVLGPQTASLKEETGVGVTKAPEVGGEETREDDPSPKAPSAILAATRPTLGGDISASGEISFDIPDANPGGGSYSKFLSQKGMNDRIPLVNIYEGMAYDDKEVNLFENIGAAAKEGGKKVADPKKAVSSIFGTVKNAFGNNSFRGFGAAGAFADMVHSLQYRDLDLIRAARTAGAADTGFAMTLGDYGITRAPGSGRYTGNTRGMDIETITALEALSKGYDPHTSHGGSRYNPLDPSKSQTVVASGGLQVSNNPMDGFIRANGSVYDPRFIGAGASGAYARTDMIEKAAGYYGVTPDQMSGALAVARSGTMNVRQALNNVLAPKLKAFQEKASQEMEAYKEEQRQRDFDQRMYGADSPRPETRAREDRERERVERTVADVKDRTEATKGSRETFAIGFADGGRVGLAMGGAPRMASGFVERPPDQVPEDQTVADDKKAQLPEGAFVINAAAAEFMGTDDVRTMLLDAHKEALRQGLVVDKQGNGAKLIDVAISRGEVVVAPHLAKIIGYDRLTKINNRGKPETRERIQENGQAAAPATMQAATGMLVSGQMVNPTLTQQDLREEGFLSKEYTPMPDIPIPSRDEDTFFGYTVGELKRAIKGVEIKGFEKNPYIRTGISRGGKESSAFGPMQVTYTTLEDFKKRSPEYRFLSDGDKIYVDDMIQQGKDFVNFQKSGAIYRNGKRQKVSKEQAKNLRAYGSGTIDRARHEEHYDLVSDMVLRLKLSDHKTLEEALASYGEGRAYAKKVLKGLD